MTRDPICNEFCSHAASQRDSLLLKIVANEISAGKGSPKIQITSWLPTEGIKMLSLLETDESFSVEEIRNNTDADMTRAKVSNYLLQAIALLNIGYISQAEETSLQSLLRVLI